MWRTTWPATSSTPSPRYADRGPPVPAGSPARRWHGPNPVRAIRSFQPHPGRNPKQPIPPARSQRASWTATNEIYRGMAAPDLRLPSGELSRGVLINDDCLFSESAQKATRTSSPGFAARAPFAVPAQHQRLHGGRELRAGRHRQVPGRRWSTRCRRRACQVQRHRGRQLRCRRMLYNAAGRSGRG